MPKKKGKPGKKKAAKKAPKKKPKKLSVEKKAQAGKAEKHSLLPEAERKALLEVPDFVLRRILLDVAEQEIIARRLARGEVVSTNLWHALQSARVLLLRQLNRFEHLLKTTQRQFERQELKERQEMAEELQEQAGKLLALLNPEKPETFDRLHREKLFWNEIWEEYRDYFLYKIEGLEPRLRRKLKKGKK